MKEKSDVFFLFANDVEMNAEVTHEVDEDENIIVELAKEKLKNEMEIDVDLLAEKIGTNDHFDGKWYCVEFVEVVE